MPSIPVKNYQNTFAGMPVLSGTAGALIAVLDACLVNGGNLMTLDSLAVASGVLTGAKAGHGFVIDQVILIAGANQSQLNGEWRVTSVTSSTFSCDATGVANVSGTGTITAKFAPAGWTKLFSATNKAVYQPADLTGSGCVLLVDDTGTTQARVRGYKSMTDISTGIDPFPTDTKVSGGGYWNKSNVASTAAREWCLYADKKTFYVALGAYMPSYVVRSFYAFGDYPSEKVGDAYNCLIQCNSSAAYAQSNYSQIGYASSGFAENANNGCSSPRSYTQVGGGITVVTATGPNGASSGRGGYLYPAPTNNGLILAPIPLKESVSGVIRSLALPGIWATPQDSPLYHGDKLRDVSLNGSLRVVQAVSFDVSAAVGQVYIDITGPWQ